MKLSNFAAVFKKTSVFKKSGTLLLAGLLALLAVTSQLQAGTIFVSDDAGNVGRFDTITNTGVALGSLGAFVPSQVIGIAYDPVADAVLILDRGTQTVFTMDAQTGAAAVLFSAAPYTFQGGAVANGLLYGIDENSQSVEAFSLPGGVDQGLTSGPLDHRHSLGVDAATGQLYGHSSFTDSIYEINADGTTGAIVVSGVDFQEDIDYFQGDFLGVDYGNTVNLINGTTGALSIYLTAAQVAAMGIVGPVSGVAYAPPAQVGAVPEPSSMAIFGALGLVATGVRRRRK